MIFTAMAVILSLPVAVSAELTEAQKKALEVALQACQQLPSVEVKACETAAMNNAASTTTTTPPTTNTTTKVVTASMQGRISVIGTNTITIGIIGNGMVNVIGSTVIVYNGKTSTLGSLFIGDTVSIKYDTATRNATLIEAQGFGFHATYIGTSVRVVSVGMIGSTIRNMHYGMITSNYAGVWLDTKAQVTINGVPATYLDIKAGDIVDYVQDSTNLWAIFVKVTR